MSQLTLTEFINLMPKADIHYHLLGGVRLQTMMELAEKYNYPLSLTEAKTYYRAYQSESGASKGGIAALTFLYDLMQEAEDYYRVVLEVAEDAHECGVRYVETFWNPSDTHLPYHAINEALVAAIDDAYAKWGIVVRLIPAINRQKSPETAVAMVKDMIHSLHPYALGIGIDYQEKNAPAEHFWKAYQLAREHGYKLTAHCSEFGLHWRNVEAAVELLKVDRIDHGYSIVDNLKLAQKYAAQQIPFTVVPSNTYFLNKWPKHEDWCQKHPIRKMAKVGLQIIPSTDDWYMHNTTTTKCYQTMVESFGFDVMSLKTFMLNSLQASWLPSAQKNEWMKAWSEEFDALYVNLEEQAKQKADNQIEYRLSFTI